MRPVRQPSPAPVQPLRDAILLAVAFNVFTLIVFTVSSLARGPESLREALLIGLPMMLVDGFISFHLFFVLRGTFDWRPAIRWAAVSAGVLAVAFLQSLWDTQLRLWAGTMTMDMRQQFVRSATLNTYNTGMLAALLAFQAAYAQMKDRERLLSVARQREREAQMLALRFQLNPHFLFNTLNAISSLVVTNRARDADSMIDRLSAFLRASLSADPDRMVRIEDEFEMLDTYLEIESVRFGERLATVIDLPPDIACAEVPPFLLQPLVENAVKYAVAPSLSPVTVGIAARRRGDRLELEVWDTGAGTASAPGTGVGLANVRERLRLSYGQAGDMHVDTGGSGFRVTLSLPLVLSQPAQRAA